jgi:hypothetical protein
MKIFFASLTNPAIEVDAHVKQLDEGILLLESLAKAHRNHWVIMRARIKQGENHEERFVGSGRKAGQFIQKVRMMGPRRLNSL